MDQQPAQGGASSVTGTGVMSGNQTVLDVLVQSGGLDKARAEQVRMESVTSGKQIEQILTEKKMVNEEALAQAKAKLLNVAYIQLSQQGSSPEALGLLPESVAKRYKIFPYAIDKATNTLYVAMANPLDLTAIEFVEKKSGMNLTVAMASESDVDLAIRERYAQSLSSEVVEALKDVGPSKKQVVDVSQLGQVIHEAPIAKIVETILSFAIKARASDVHIEPQETKTRVRYRIDGILHEKLVLPREVHDSVVSRIKILARMKIDERRLPQDGRFTFRIGQEEVDLRISSLPTVYGEKMVMRLLKKTGKVPTLPELGLRGRALANLERAILVPHGIILMTGPTGSGKTTTLYSILNKINSPKVNIVTLEDPVEYEISGINQVQTNPQAGLTFASGLRSFLRQDPNIIMVGEIRDKETTELAIQASLTGHLVFSTLHTNNASGALPRLVDLEAEPFLLASSMTLVAAQRVVRRVCSHCAQEFEPNAQMIQDIKNVLGVLFDGFLKQHKRMNGKIVLHKGKGCGTCGDSGYLGRVGIFEVLPVTEKIGRLIVESAPAGAIEKAALEEGMILMKQDGYLKALEGMTTIEEVLRVAEV